MKKLFVFLIMAFALPLFIDANEKKINLVNVQKSYSQRTYTLFSDGHYERKTCYNDGSCDPLEQGFFKIPQKGDYKHIEEVWNNGKWVQTVVQYY